MQRRSQLQRERARWRAMGGGPAYVPAARVVPGPPRERLLRAEVAGEWPPAPGEHEHGGLPFPGRQASQDEPGPVDLWKDGRDRGRASRPVLAAAGAEHAGPRAGKLGGFGPGGPGPADLDGPSLAERGQVRNRPAVRVQYPDCGQSVTVRLSGFST